MSAKRAIIGFRGVALAPILTDTITAYETGAGAALAIRGADEPLRQGKQEPTFITTTTCTRS